jgi:hypothetical protein
MDWLMRAMNLNSPIFWFLIIVLALGGLVVLIIRNASKHRKDFAALAKELGFTYEPESPELLETFKEFRFFLPDPDCIHRSAFNVLKGKIESATVWLFDYHYSIRGSKFSHDFTICALSAPELRLPYFYLRHRWLTEKLGRSSPKKIVIPESDPSAVQYVGSEVDFSEDAKFNETFVLHGKEGVLRPLFDVDLRQHLLPLGDIWHTPSTLEGYRDTLMLIAVAPTEQKDARELINRAMNLLPQFSRRS